VAGRNYSSIYLQELRIATKTLGEVNGYTSKDSNHGSP
jgi:hypothetical protein